MSELLKVEVWTRGGPDREYRRYHAPKCVWCGTMAAIPRIGDYVEVRDGCASEPVRSVAWRLERGVVMVTLETVDSEGTYGEVAT